MSTIFAGYSGAANARLSLVHWMKRARLPLEAWSPRRRCVVALLIAALVFGLGAHGWVVGDLSGVEASRAALDATSLRLANAQRVLAQLPALRRESADSRAAAFNTRSTERWSSADDVRIVSELAARSEVALLAVEPGPVSGVGAESMRPLQLTARTDFVHLMAFLNGLPDLPVLIVPVDVSVKRDAAALMVSATLRVFDMLRPVPSVPADAFADESLGADDDEDIVFFDPFSQPRIQAADDLADLAQMRLVGLLRDRTRGLALLDTPDGVTSVEAGERIGAERVTKLDASGITLAKQGSTRTLALAEAS